MKFVNASGVPANFVAPGDYSFWGLLNQVIQEEPAEGCDPTTLGPVRLHRHRQRASPSIPMSG